MAGTPKEEAMRLEGFAESLRGGRVAIVGTNPKEVAKVLLGKLATLDGEVAHRGRKILVVSGVQTVPRWCLTPGFHWDAVFLIRDVQDLKLAATVIQHCAKPARVVWVGTEPPTAFLAAMGRLDALTLFAALEHAPPTSQEWQAVFWTPDATVEDVESAVLGRMGAGRVSSLRAVIKELRAADVGLVWSSIGESDKHGDLYWYDPREGVDLAPTFNLVDAVETLRSLADYLVRRV